MLIGPTREKPCQPGSRVWGEGQKPILSDHAVQFHAEMLGYAKRDFAVTAEELPELRPGDEVGSLLRSSASAVNLWGVFPITAPSPTASPGAANPSVIVLPPFDVAVNLIVPVHRMKRPRGTLRLPREQHPTGGIEHRCGEFGSDPPEQFVGRAQKSPFSRMPQVRQLSVQEGLPASCSRVGLIKVQV